MLRARIVFVVLAAACLLIGLSGCNSGDREVNSSPADQATSSQGTTGGAGPMTGGGATPGAGPTTGGQSGGEPPLNVIPVKDAQSAYDKAKKDFDKSPADAKAKSAYEDAANTLADSTMQSDSPPNVKYPAALKLYREVAKIDPQNSHATYWVKQITDIYASMGKQPPGGG